MKTAVITGATSGIGNLVLKEFLDEGYTVYAGYRDIKHKKELMSLSENVIPFRIDLSKKWTIDEAVKTINEGTESIDVLVNAAGKVVAGPLENLPVSKIREQFEVNTFGHLEFAQGLFEKLDGGKIINISSMASYGIFPFIAPYCASKNALDMLFNSLRMETGSKVKIISVRPGVVATPLWSKSIEENKDNLGTGKYKIVSDFLIANALKNASNGLNPSVVAKKILSIAKSENPKTVYNIGLDSLFVRMISKLPQKMLDRLIEKQLVKRVKAQMNEVLLVHDNSQQEYEYPTPENTEEKTYENTYSTYESSTVETVMDRLYEPETDISLSNTDFSYTNTEETLSTDTEQFEKALENVMEENAPKPKKRGRRKKSS